MKATAHDKDSLATTVELNYEDLMDIGACLLYLYVTYGEQDLTLLGLGVDGHARVKQLNYEVHDLLAAISNEHYKTK